MEKKLERGIETADKTSTFHSRMEDSRMEESSNTSMIACLAGGQPGLTETNNLLQGMQVQIANDWV